MIISREKGRAMICETQGGKGSVSLSHSFLFGGESFKHI